MTSDLDDAIKEYHRRKKREYAHNYYLKHKAQRLAEGKEYRNRPEVKERIKENYRKWYKRNHLWRNAYESARTRLTPTQFEDWKKHHHKEDYVD